MYVIAVEPNKKAHTKIIDDDLNALQKAVGVISKQFISTMIPLCLFAIRKESLTAKK